MKRLTTPLWIAALIAVVMLSAQAQEVMTNDLNMTGHNIYSNTVIPLASSTNTQDDADTCHFVPTVGQMYGIDPDTGNALDNGDLLTLKPQAFSLETAGNRVFVIRADQITSGGGISIGYDGSNLVISVDTDNDLDLGTNALTGVTEIRFEDGTLALSPGTQAGGIFAGNSAGDGNSGEWTTGVGDEAAKNNSGESASAFGASAGEDNEGDHLAALGTSAGRGNDGSKVSAVGFCAGFGNEGDYVSATGYNSAGGNSGDHVVATGYSAAEGNSGDHVTALGQLAGRLNSGQNCILIGKMAGFFNSKDNVTVIGDSITGFTLSPRTCYLDGDLVLKNCGYTGGGTKMTFANDAAITTTASSFGFGNAAITNAAFYGTVPLQGDISMGSYTNAP